MTPTAAPGTPSAPASVNLADVTTFGPALRLAVLALRARAERYSGAFAPTDARVATEAAGKLEALIQLLELHHDLDGVEPERETRPARRAAPALLPNGDRPDRWADIQAEPNAPPDAPPAVDRARLEMALPASVRGALWDILQVWDVPGFDAWPAHPVVGEFLHVTAVLTERKRIERGMKLSPTPALREACARLRMPYQRVKSRLRLRRTRTGNENGPVPK